MSDNESIEDVNIIIDKSYNINYDVNDRLKFLQNKYKDYDFNINIRNNKLITFRKKGTKIFRSCCINFDCIKQPQFCIKGETKTTHCGACAKIVSKKEDIKMENIADKNKKCILCKIKYASFCKIGDAKATHCATCAEIVSEEKDIEMENIVNKTKKCIICKKTTPSFYKIGETKPTHCGKCKENEMVSSDKRICKNILQSGKQCKTLAHLKKYKGYCFHCYFKINPDEIPVRNIKIKEQAVVDYIDELYSKNYDIIYDKPIGNTNKSPDIVMNCENYVIIIEVDEFQHKKNSYKGGHYSKENEENKMKIIRDYFKTQNKKTIYLRFNPDDYLSKDNIKIKSPWKEDEDKLLVIVDETDWNNRLAKLKEKVDYYLKKNTIKNNSTKYLFYE